MGTLRYGSAEFICEFDDQTLAHLAVAIYDMLHRGEEFLFSFQGVDGPTTLRLSPSVSLRFDFGNSAAVPINGDWISELELAARTGAGLDVTAEPRTRPQVPPPALAAAVRS